MEAVVIDKEWHGAVIDGIDCVIAGLVNGWHCFGHDVFFRCRESCPEDIEKEWIIRFVDIERGIWESVA